MEFFSKAAIKKIQACETPFYFYNLEILDLTLEALKKAVDQSNFHIHYAIKANANNEVLERIKAHDLGIDTVSGQEIRHALDLGFNPKKIAFAGVGKTDKEIRLALQSQIFSLNVESLPELKVIDALAREMNIVAPIALRLNPNVNAKTHHYITTGLEENKFGINFWELDEVIGVLNQSEHLSLDGLHFHIGSQITDLSVFKNLCNRINDLQVFFKERSIDINHINVGGGLGVNYTSPDEELIPDFEAYFKIFKRFLNPLPHQDVHFELGRSLVAQCASLITKVLYVKKGIKTNFLILDAGMTELIRPALYQSVHYIQNLSSSSNEQEKYDVVGPICESSDCFGKAIDLPMSQRGDIMAIRTTGAYGEVMSSNYNLREKVNTLYHDEI